MPLCTGALAAAATPPINPSPESPPPGPYSMLELNEKGMGQLRVADLNHDGFLDLVDVILWELGERP